MNREQLSVKSMTSIGILAALIIIMGYTPLGLIPLPFAAATILHIPVLIGSFLLGPRIGFFLGTIMGLTTCTRAYLAPTGVLDPLFMNPLLSVLPRMLIGVIAYYSLKGLTCFITNKMVRLTLASVVGSLANTFLTLGMLLVLYNGATSSLAGAGSIQITGALVGGIIATSGILEAIITPILVIPVITAIKKIGIRY